MVVIALAAGGYLYLRLDDEIRHQVERTFANHYRYHVVRVSKARYEQGLGITINGLSIAEPLSDGTTQPMLAIDELFLACDMRMEEMLSGKPRLERIVVRRPRLRAIRLADGRWNVRSLVPLPKLSDQSPQMHIEEATLILEDATRHDVAPLALRGVDLKLTPIAAAGPPRFQVSGSATGTPARQLSFVGTAGCADGSLDLVVDVRALAVSPELISAIPGPHPASLTQVRFYGSTDATIRLARTSANVPLDWSADVTVTRGRVEQHLLPLPFTEITAKIAADPRRMRIEQLNGKFGTADVVLAVERNGWGDAAPFGLAGRVVGLSVDPQLEAKLPGAARRLWQRFQPAGVVDAEIALTFDGQRWRPELTAHGRGLSLTDAEKFPYPLSQVTGSIRLTGSPTQDGDMRLVLDLAGQANRQVIAIAADLDKIAVPKMQASALPQRLPTTQTAAGSPKPVGWIEVSGTGVSLHEQLFAALPDTAEPFVRSLHPQGKIDFRWRYDRLDPLAPKADTQLELKFVDCAIQYDRFPYPLEHIEGIVTAQNGLWMLRDIQSRDRHGQASVTCDGESQMTPAGHQLRLVFNGKNVLLDDNLKQALEPRAQEVWTQLRPQGRIDFTAHVARQPGQVKPEVLVDLRPHGQSVSIEPTFFPYRLEQIGGRALASPGRVELQSVQARHGRSTFAAQGNWQATPDGGWHLALTALNADRLTLDPDLTRALPPGVQKVVERLRPMGSFNLFNSSLSFARGHDATCISSAWDVQVACHQAALRGDLPLDNLTGGIRILGSSDGPNCQSYGELAIDSLIYHDVQLTNIRGPFWTDSTFCLLGRHATEKLNQPPRRITADAFGGAITGDMQMQHTGRTRYAAEMSLAAVDLGRIARERLGGPADMTGSISGTLSLAGAGRSVSALTGRGNLQVVDANIYQLPPLVALLSVLRNKTPNTTAFNRCDMLFDISGEHIHFHDLKLLGDAVSLYGRGETNFDRQLNLVFYTMVGVADLPIPHWQTVVGQLSQQGLQLTVDGTWDNPQIHRKAFPAVAQMLDQIREEAQQTTATPPPAAAKNRWTPPLR